MSEELESVTEGLGDVTEPARARRPLALSPSRASDFKTCPLLYRFRAVDKLPEPQSPDAARGTLVHAVLEDMFGLPPVDRTVETVLAQVRPTWERMAAEREEWPSMLAADALAPWLESARELVRTYFTLEDPTTFSPEARELMIEIEVAGGIPLRGYVDRLDVAHNGAIRVVDYKTGRSPAELFEQSALFQMKFYALMVLRTRGVLPLQLKLLYLGDSRYLTYSPTQDELLAFERGLGALWEAIRTARRTGDFPPRPSRMCEWCAHHATCPAWGGILPPYPFPDDSAAVAELPTSPTGIPSARPASFAAPTAAADPVTAPVAVAH